MCGIFGVLFRDSREPSGELLRRSGVLLGHRGPDHLGVYSAPGIGLVHTRLSLLDLSERGNQPLWDDSGRYALVYNGEIYNFQSLRDELAASGVAFSTATDTEVLLKGILAFGADAFLPRLEGMFAFGLWDSQERCLTLARDRLAIKPLSVYVDDQMLVFSSEIKAMEGWISLRPDSHMVSAFLAGFGGGTRDKSFFANVKMLAPGAIVSVTQDLAPRTRTFFEIVDFWQPDEHRALAALSDHQVIDLVDEKLQASVQKHLIADAPVGALCSGGLDSSLVLAMAARTHDQLALFHADVEGPLTEIGAAKALARHLKLDLLSVSVRDDDFLREMASVLWHYEYPFMYHPNSVPFAAVTRLVRQSGVKAVLSGEGADECFLGYGPIAYSGVTRRYHDWLTRLRLSIQRLPKIGQLLWPRIPGHHGSVWSLQQNFEHELDRKRLREKVRGLDPGIPERELLSLAWLGYHLRTLLHRNDALGMASSVEARFPYLDHALVTLAASLPYRHKIRPSIAAMDPAHPFFIDKWVLRKVAERYIPRALSHRKKIGFPTNAYTRLRCDQEFFREGFVAQQYQLDKRAVAELWQASDPEFNVRIVMLEAWGQLYFQRRPQAEVTASLMRHASIAPLGG